MITRRKKLPPFNDSTLSLDFRLDFAGCTVYIVSYKFGLYVVCKGFCPKRVDDDLMQDKYVFCCDSYDECVNLFRDFCMEVLHSV